MPQVLDLSQWSKRPLFLNAIRLYCLSEMQDRARQTRAKKLVNLGSFRTYLNEAHPEISGLDALTGTVVAGYVSWLNGRRKRNGSPLGAMSKGIMFVELVLFLTFCRKTPELNGQLNPDLNIRRNPWPARHRGIVSRAALPHSDLIKIRDACIADVEAIEQALEFGTAASQDESIVVPPLGTSKPASFNDMRVKLRALTKCHGDVPLRYSLIVEDSPGLARSLQNPYAKLSNVAAHLYFTSETIVPYVLLLAMETMFNPETVLRLRWSDIKRQHFSFGADRWQVFGDKPRAGRRQTRSFSARAVDVGAPVVLLKSLERHGQRARAVAPELADFVFLHWQKSGPAFNAFEDEQTASGGTAWSRPLAAFRERHGLPAFTLATLRATAADLLDDVTGGDVKAKQILLGHTNLSTTIMHYHSSKSKLLGREALAKEIDLLERFAESEGRVDTRGDDKEIGRSAATPGFRCVDPLFSPIPGQKQGRPCSAYGACPTCPQAFVDLDDARALRRLKQFQGTIREAEGKVHPQRWIDVWQPRLASLQSDWIDAFGEHVTTEASKLDLPPLPEIE